MTEAELIERERLVWQLRKWRGMLQSLKAECHRKDTPENKIEVIDTLVSLALNDEVP